MRYTECLIAHGAAMYSIPNGNEVHFAEVELGSSLSLCCTCSLHSHSGACEGEACLLWQRPRHPLAVWRLNWSCPAAMRDVPCPLPGPARSSAAAAPQPWPAKIMHCGIMLCRVSGSGAEPMTDRRLTHVRRICDTSAFHAIHNAPFKVWTRTCSCAVGLGHGVEASSEMAPSCCPTCAC
jgi:hypothetical protein